MASRTLIILYADAAAKELYILVGRLGVITIGSSERGPRLLDRKNQWVVREAPRHYLRVGCKRAGFMALLREHDVS